MLLIGAAACVAVVHAMPSGPCGAAVRGSPPTVRASESRAARLGVADAAKPSVRRACRFGMRPMMSLNPSESPFGAVARGRHASFSTHAYMDDVHQSRVVALALSAHDGAHARRM